MRVEEYKHTWVIPRNAWYIRLYMLLWNADEKDITFCKLFWGYALCWVAIILRIVAIPLFLIALIPSPDRKPAAECVHGAAARSCETCKALRKEERDAKKLARKERRRNKLPMRVLNAVSNGMVVVIQHIATVVRKCAWVPGALFILGCICLVGGLIAVGYEAYTTIPVKEGLQILLIIGAAAVAVVALTALIVGAILLFTEAGVGLGPKMGHGAKKGGLKFRDVMRIGYVGVKSNTCPRVVIGHKEDK